MTQAVETREMTYPRTIAQIRLPEVIRCVCQSRDLPQVVAVLRLGTSLPSVLRVLSSLTATLQAAEVGV